MASIQVGKEFRSFKHSTNQHRPSRRLPWPLSKFQPFWFDVRIRETELGPMVAGMRLPPPIDYEKELKERVVNFTHQEIEKGMEFFLKDSMPDDLVVIQYNSVFFFKEF
jgi:hypothetical protein